MIAWRECILISSCVLPCDAQVFFRVKLNKELKMESSNPTLNERTFGAARVGVGEPAMTIQGTVNKSFILLVVLMATAMWTWSMSYNPANFGFLQIMFYGSMIAGFIIAMVTSFNPKWSPV